MIAGGTNDLEWVVILTDLKNMADCLSGISKVSILKDCIYLENRFIYKKLEAILFEEMRRIDLQWEIGKYTASFLSISNVYEFCCFNFCLKT